MAPIAAAFRMPSVQTYLPTLSVPLVRIPTLAVPKLHAVPKHAAKPTLAKPAHRATPTHGKRKLVKRRVPIHTDKYTQSAMLPAKQGISADPFAKVPVVEDTVGAPPIIAPNPTPPATTAAQSAPAPAPAPAPATTDTSTTPAAPDAGVPDPTSAADATAAPSMSLGEEYVLLNPPDTGLAYFDYSEPADP
ncbi:MAG TPA: hypothetical protein VIL98_08455, partial [Gaiellaceae bacterium]